MPNNFFRFSHLALPVVASVFIIHSVANRHPRSSLPSRRSFVLLATMPHLTVSMNARPCHPPRTPRHEHQSPVRSAPKKIIVRTTFTDSFLSSSVLTPGQADRRTGRYHTSPLPVRSFHNRRNSSADQLFSLYVEFTKSRTLLLPKCVLDLSVRILESLRERRFNRASFPPRTPDYSGSFNVTGDAKQIYRARR